MLYSDRNSELADTMPEYTPLKGHSREDVEKASGGGTLSTFGDLEEVAQSLAHRPGGSAWVVYNFAKTRNEPTDKDLQYVVDLLALHRERDESGTTGIVQRAESRLQAATTIADLIDLLSDLPELDGQEAAPWLNAHLVTLYNKSTDPLHPDLVVVDIAAGPKRLTTIPEDLADPAALLNTAVRFQDWMETEQKKINNLSGTDREILAIGFDDQGNFLPPDIIAPPAKHTQEKQDRFALAGQRPADDLPEPVERRSPDDPPSKPEPAADIAAESGRARSGDVDRPEPEKTVSGRQRSEALARVRAEAAAELARHGVTVDTGGPESGIDPTPEVDGVSLDRLREWVVWIDALGAAVEDAWARREQAAADLAACIAACRDLDESAVLLGSEALTGVPGLRDRVRTALTERLSRESAPGTLEGPGVSTLRDRLRDLDAVVLATEQFDYYDGWFETHVEHVRELELRAEQVRAARSELVRAHDSRTNPPRFGDDRLRNLVRVFDTKLRGVIQGIGDYGNPGLGSELHRIRDAAVAESAKKQGELSRLLRKWGTDPGELLRRGSPTASEWTEELGAACRALAQALDIPVEYFDSLEKIRARLEELTDQSDERKLRAELRKPYIKLYEVYSVMAAVDTIHRADLRAGRIDAFEAALRDVAAWFGQARSQGRASGEIAAIYHQLAVTAHRLDKMATDYHELSPEDALYFEALGKRHKLKFWRLRPGSLETEKLDFKIRQNRHSLGTLSAGYQSALSTDQFERLVQESNRMPLPAEGKEFVPDSLDEGERELPAGSDFVDLHALADAAATVEKNRVLGAELDDRLAAIALGHAYVRSALGDSRDPARLMNLGPGLVELREKAVQACEEAVAACEKAVEASEFARRNVTGKGGTSAGRAVWTVRSGSRVHKLLDIERKGLRDGIVRKYGVASASVTREWAEQRIAELAGVPDVAAEREALVQFRDIESVITSAHRFHRYDAWVRAIDALDQAIEEAQQQKVESELRLANRRRVARADTTGDGSRSSRELAAAVAEHRESVRWSEELAEAAQALGELAGAWAQGPAAQHITEERFGADRAGLETLNTELDERFAAVALSIAIRKARTAAGEGVSAPSAGGEGNAADDEPGSGGAPIGSRPDDGPAETDAGSAEVVSHRKRPGGGRLPAAPFHMPAVSTVFQRVLAVVADREVARAITQEAVDRLAVRVTEVDDQALTRRLWKVADGLLFQRLRDGIRSAARNTYVEGDVIDSVLREMTPVEWNKVRGRLGSDMRKYLTTRFLRGLSSEETASALHLSSDDIEIVEWSAICELARSIDAERGGPDARELATYIDAENSERKEMQHVSETDDNTGVLNVTENFGLDRSTYQLRHADTGLELTPQEFDVLWVLVQRPGYVVTLDDFAVFFGSPVEPGTIHDAVRRLQDRLGSEICIVTLRDVGWRFDGLPVDRTVIDEMVAADPEMLDEGSVRLSPDARRVWVDGREVVLTRTEFDLLKFLMKKADLVLSRSRIEEEVWGNVAETGGRLQTQIRNLRKKLGNQHGRLIETVAAGYRFNSTMTSAGVRDKAALDPPTDNTAWLNVTDNFGLDRSELRVRHVDTVLPLGRDAFDVLWVLVQRPGYVVTLDDFTEFFGSPIQPGTIHDAVWRLRNSLASENCIATLKNVGWRFDGLPVDRTVIDEMVAADPEMLDEGSVRLSPDARRVWVDGREVVLTRIEFDLLKFLMKKADLVLSRSRIEEEVWGNVAETGGRLQTQIRNLRRKLGKQHGRLIETVAAGYRFNSTRTSSGAHSDTVVPQDIPTQGGVRVPSAGVDGNAAPYESGGPAIGTSPGEEAPAEAELGSHGGTGHTGKSVSGVDPTPGIDGTGPGETPANTAATADDKVVGPRVGARFDDDAASVTGPATSVPRQDMAGGVGRSAPAVFEEFVRGPDGLPLDVAPQPIDSPLVFSALHTLRFPPGSDTDTAEPADTAAAAVERGWRSLSDAQQRAVVVAYPEVVGRLTGVPVRIRDIAMRLALARAVDSAYTRAGLIPAEIDPALLPRDSVLARLSAEHARLQEADLRSGAIPGGGPVVYLLDTPLGGNGGRTILAFDDPDTTERVACHFFSGAPDLRADPVIAIRNAYESTLRAGAANASAVLYLDHELPATLPLLRQKRLKPAQRSAEHIARFLAEIHRVRNEPHTPPLHRLDTFGFGSAGTALSEAAAGGRLNGVITTLVHLHSHGKGSVSDYGPDIKGYAFSPSRYTPAYKAGPDPTFEGDRMTRVRSEIPVERAFQEAHPIANLFFDLLDYPTHPFRVNAPVRDQCYWFANPHDRTCTEGLTGIGLISAGKGDQVDKAQARTAQRDPEAERPARWYRPLEAEIPEHPGVDDAALVRAALSLRGPDVTIDDLSHRGLDDDATRAAELTLTNYHWWESLGDPDRPDELSPTQCAILREHPGVACQMPGLPLHAQGLAGVRQLELDRAELVPEAEDRRLWTDTEMQQLRNVLGMEEALGVATGVRPGIEQPPVRITDWDRAAFDNDGKAIVHFGDTDHADYVADLIPGMMSDAQTLPRLVAMARNLYESLVLARPGAEIAVRLRLGHDAPSGKRSINETIRTDIAESAGRIVHRDLVAWHAKRTVIAESGGSAMPYFTVHSHSYGGVTAHFAMQNMQLSDIVAKHIMYGVPATGPNEHVSETGIDTIAMYSPTDPVPKFGATTHKHNGRLGRFNAPKSSGWGVGQSYLDNRKDDRDFEAVLIPITFPDEYPFNKAFPAHGYYFNEVDPDTGEQVDSLRYAGLIGTDKSQQIPAEAIYRRIRRYIDPRTPGQPQTEANDGAPADPSREPASPAPAPPNDTPSPDTEYDSTGPAIGTASDDSVPGSAGRHIVVVGPSAYWCTIAADELPGPGEARRVKPMRLDPGGSALVSALTLARNSDAAVSVITTVGDDTFAQGMHAELERNLGSGGVRVVPGAESAGSVHFVVDGQESVLRTAAAGLEVTVDDIAQNLAMLQAADAVLITDEVSEEVERAIGAAVGAGERPVVVHRMPPQQSSPGAAMPDAAETAALLSTVLPDWDSSGPVAGVADPGRLPEFVSDAPSRVETGARGAVQQGVPAAEPRSPGSPRIVVFGSAVADVVIRHDGFPEPGQTVDAESVRVNPGGKGFNLAVQAARLGAAAQLVTAIGADAPGSRITEVLDGEGIGSSGVRIEEQEPTETVTCLLNTTTSDASFLEHTSPGVKLTAADVERAAALIGDADIVVITYEVRDDVVAAICAVAKRHGKQIVLQPAPAPEQFSKETVGMADVLVPNEVEARALLAGVGVDDSSIPAHELPGALSREFGVETIVVTLGAKGCVVRHNGRTRQFPADAVDAVVETIGASDSFTATLAWRLASGDSVDEAVPVALSAAAQTVGRPGGYASMPHLSDLPGMDGVGAVGVAGSAAAGGGAQGRPATVDDMSFERMRVAILRAHGADVENEAIGRVLSTMTRSEWARGYATLAPAMQECLTALFEHGLTAWATAAVMGREYSPSYVRSLSRSAVGQVAKFIVAERVTGFIDAARNESEAGATATGEARAAAAGKQVISTPSPIPQSEIIFDAGRVWLDPAARRVWVYGTEIQLNDEEFAVLDLLTLRPRGRAIPAAEIERALRDEGLDDGASVHDLIQQLESKPGLNESILSVRGGYLFAADVDLLLVGGIRAYPTERRVSFYGREIKLSSREFALFVFLATQPHQAVARSEIEEAVWGERHRDGNALSSLVRQLKRKLSTLGVDGWLTPVSGGGYRFGPEMSTAPDAIDQGRITLLPAAREVWVDGVAVSLGPRQFEMVKFFMERDGESVSREELRDRFWGRGSQIKPGSVTAYVSVLRSRLGDPEFITYVGEGWRFDGRGSRRSAEDAAREEVHTAAVDRPRGTASGQTTPLIGSRTGDETEGEDRGGQSRRGQVGESGQEGRQPDRDGASAGVTETPPQGEPPIGTRSGEDGMSGRASTEAELPSVESAVVRPGPAGSELRDKITFRYVTGRALTDLAPDMVELNRSSWDGDETRLGVKWWTDPKFAPGAVVAEVGGPGGKLVGFCIGQKSKDLSGQVHLDIRASGPRGENPNVLNPGSVESESDVHITAMLVDQEMRGRRIADAMAYTLLLHRRESSFSLYVRPENGTAIKVYERVAGSNTPPLGRRLGTGNNDLLYRVKRDPIELLRRRRQLEEWGFRGTGATLVWTPPAGTEEQPETDATTTPEDSEVRPGAEQPPELTSEQAPDVDPDAVARRRPAEMLSGDISFRYVTGQDLVDLAESVKELNGASWDGDSSRLGVEWWGDPAVYPGAVVAEMDGPGGRQLVGFCIGRLREELSESSYLDARRWVRGNRVPLHIQFGEPNVHIESMLVDQSVRGFRIADAMMYAFLRNRTEPAFTLHVASENEAAIQVCERVGGPGVGPLGLRPVENDVLYHGPNSTLQLDDVRRQLDEWGFTGGDRDLVLKGPAPTEWVPDVDPGSVASRRSLDILPGDISFRYVAEEELADLEGSIAELNETSWDGDSTRLGIAGWADPDRKWGAIVAEVGGPGGQLVGFCLAGCQDLSGSTYLDARAEVESARNRDLLDLDPQFAELNLHIESMLVDQNVRGFRIADAMVYMLLLHRSESSFSLHVFPENETAIRVYERVGGPGFSPLGLRLGRRVGDPQDVLYQGTKSTEQLRDVQRQLEEWGFSGHGPDLVLRRVTPVQRREAIARLHPHAYSSAAKWARNVRLQLGMSPGRMDYLIGAPSGTWHGVEKGEIDLTIGQVRALLRRIPGAEAWYSALAEGFFPDLTIALPRAGSKMRSIRERANIRAEQLAVRLGTSVAELDRLEATASWPESKGELLWYLRGLTSLLPASAVLQAGADVGVCLGALRAHAGLNLESFAEKVGVGPAEIPRIEAGSIEPSDMVIEAYLRALAPGTPGYPEGYRNEVGEYLKYLRQSSGETLVAAAEAVGKGMTTARLDSCESGRAVPSVDTVSAYLDAYSRSAGRVSIEECVEAFPELRTAAARRAAESEQAAANAENPDFQIPEPAAKPPAAELLAADEVSPDRVRLNATAELSDADDLVQAIVAGADEFAKIPGADRRTGSILRRFPDWEEVTSDGDRKASARSFKFRVFERRPDRTVDDEPDWTEEAALDPTVAGRRRPKVTEVEVRLTKSAAGGDWEGTVSEPSTQRDPALWKLARLPEAAPNPVKAQQLIGVGVGLAAEALSLLDVSTVVAEYGPATESERVTVRTAEGNRQVSVDDESTCRSVTVMFTDRTTAQFDVRVDRVHRRLVVSTPDGRLVRTAQIRASGFAEPVELAHAVTVALTEALGKVVNIHRGHKTVTPEDPRYERDESGKLEATRAARMDAVMLLLLDRLLAMKPRTKQQHRYLFELRREVLHRLEFARGTLSLRRERLAALRAMSARLEYAIKRHWGPWKIRKPAALHPEAAPSFLAHYLLSLLAAGSNIAPAFAGVPGQSFRYAVGSASGSLYLAFGRHESYLSMSQREKSGDPAPRWWIYDEKGTRHFWANFGGATADAVARVGGSLILIDAGVLTESFALLAGLGSRRVASGYLKGIKARKIQPMYAAPVDLTAQTQAVARRGEAYDRYAELHAESLRWLGQLENYLKVRGPLNDGELSQLADIIHRLSVQKRAAAALIDKYGLGAAALRTKASPNSSPSGMRVLRSSWLDPVGSAAVGTLAGWLFGDPWVGLLGAGGVFWALLQARMSRIWSQGQDIERAMRVQRNNAYRDKKWDDRERAVQREIARLLGQEAYLLDPLPAARRKWIDPLPYVVQALPQAFVEAAFSAPLLFVSDFGTEWAWMVLLARLLSPLTNRLRKVAEEMYDVYKSNWAEEIDDRIALEERFDSASDFVHGLSGIAGEYDELVRDTEETFDADDIPDFSGAVSPAAVHQELMKKGEAKKNSSVALSVFKQVVAEKNTPDLFDIFIASITDGFEELDPGDRAGKAADAFLYWHEKRVANIGKLAMVYEYMAEHLPPELQLAALFTEDERTPLNTQFCEFARVVAKLWMVAPIASPEKINHEIEDYTGRFLAVALHAAARNAVRVPDRGNTGESRLDTVDLGNLLATAAEFIERDIARLAHGSNLDDLLTDTAPPGTSMKTASKAELDSARNLLRIALADRRYFAKYVDRLTRWLEDTREPIVVTSGRGFGTPDPVAVWLGKSGTRGPLIGSRSDAEDQGSHSRSGAVSGIAGGGGITERPAGGRLPVDGFDDRVVGAVFGRVLRGVGDPAVAGAITAEAVGRVDGVVADADDVESVGELFVAADVVMVERLRGGIRAGHRGYVEGDVVGRVLQTMTPTEWVGSRGRLGPEMWEWLSARF
ncbi:PfkB family carbohydrate kinase, partial [Nocardia sp. NPDC004568]|uniref:PfkB family carbohydrate kinase n=1 Tax=Nocardia sp. NPDC004568 TaxID=3154551 RepID=UPI0033BDD635